MELSSGIIFGLIAMLGFGLSNSLSKIPAERIGSRNTIFFRGIFMSMTLLILLPFFLSSTTFALRYMMIAFAISIIAFIPLLTFIKALGLGKIGVISPIANSSVIFTILFSILLFGETLNSVKLGSIVLIVLGIILVSIDFRDIRNSNLFSLESGIPYAIITCVLWGLLFSLFKIPVLVIGPILTSLIVEIGILLIASSIVLKNRKRINIPNKNTMTYILLFSIFSVLGSLSFNWGIMVLEVSIVAALAMSNPLVSVLYGRYIYNETISLQQYIAISFILMGIIALSFF